MPRSFAVLALAASPALLAAAVQPTKKPAPPPPPLEAPLPLLNYVFPAGGQRGQTVEITAYGTNVVVTGDHPEVNSVLVTGGGVTGKVLEAKEPNKARFSLTIAKDAALGEREIRVVTPGGVSNRFRFFIGEFPEVNEAEPNNEKEKAQRIPSIPAVINGQIQDQDRDCFRFPARAGQTLVLETKARAIVPFIANAVPGWFDPVITIYDADGKELQYADDFHLRPDPVMFFHVPRDGEYILEVKDIIYRGRGDFIYRVTIGAFPYVTDIYPLGGRRGTDVQVQLRGVNLASTAKKVSIPTDAPPVISVEGLPFAASDLPEIAEAEPNDTQTQAQRVDVPAIVNGRIEKSGDADYYTFHCAAAQKLVFEVQARRLDSPLDSMLTLFNAKGDQLAENDDWTDPLAAMATHHADSRIAWTCPAAADYTLRIRDTQANFGPDYAYRLWIVPQQPDFALRILPDNPRLGQGDTGSITVTAVKKDGFDSEIHLAVENLPPGFVSSEASIPPGQTEGRITITAPLSAAQGILAPVIVGTATAGKDTVMRKAFSAEAVMQAFAYTHNVPTKQVFLAVVKPAAYSLTTSIPVGKLLEVAQESELPIVIKIQRKEGAKGAVSFSAARGAAGINVKSVFVPADKDEATVTLAVTNEAKVGLKQNILISGVMKTGKETIVRYIPAIPIQVVAAETAASR
jgi:hypothetical protein